jgi:hypothetical protein
VAAEALSALSQTEINARNQVELHATTLKHIASGAAVNALLTVSLSRRVRWWPFSTRRWSAAVCVHNLGDAPADEVARSVGLATFTL